MQGALNYSIWGRRHTIKLITMKVQKISLRFLQKQCSHWLSFENDVFTAPRQLQIEQPASKLSVRSYPIMEPPPASSLWYKKILIHLDSFHPYFIRNSLNCRLLLPFSLNDFSTHISNHSKNRLREVLSALFSLRSLLSDAFSFFSLVNKTLPIVIITSNIVWNIKSLEKGRGTKRLCERSNPVRLFLLHCCEVWKGTCSSFRLADVLYVVSWDDKIVNGDDEMWLVEIGRGECVFTQGFRRAPGGFRPSKISLLPSYFCRYRSSRQHEWNLNLQGLRKPLSWRPEIDPRCNFPRSEICAWQASQQHFRIPYMARVFLFPSSMASSS